MEFKRTRSRPGKSLDCGEKDSVVNLLPLNLPLYSVHFAFPDNDLFRHVEKKLCRLSLFS